MAVVMNNTYKLLEVTEIELIKAMQQILTDNKRNATYKLYNSFEGDLKVTKNSMAFKITYAPHGAFVLDSRRNVKSNKKPIAAIKAWILSKGISIGKGRVRTPLKLGGKKVGRAEAERISNDKKLTSFAFAIWATIKKNRRVKARPTNFLKPYNNLMKSSFKTALGRAVAKDTISIISPIIAGKNGLNIKIKA